MIDEFHERSVNTDLALAFLKEAMLLRDDLYVVIMSATIETKKLQEYLGDGNKEAVPVMNIPGRQFPVKEIYMPEKSVTSAVREAMSLEEKNILVFLPGIADIRKAQEELKASGLFDEDEDNELCLLHSSISLEEQKRVISSPTTVVP